MSRKKNWELNHTVTLEKMTLAREALEEIRNGKPVEKALRSKPLPGGGYLGKYALVAAYREMVELAEMEEDPRLLARIRMKPVRTL